MSSEFNFNEFGIVDAPPDSVAADGQLLFLQGSKGAYALFDYVVSLLAVVVNIVVLVSVVRARISLTGYKYFLVSLGASNLYLCCVNISIFVNDALRLVIDSACLSRVFRSLQMAGLIANLLNLSGMSLDHLIGVNYPFAYDRVMKKTTVKIFLALLWTTALLLGSAELPLTTLFFISSQPSNNNLIAGVDLMTSSSAQEMPFVQQLFLESNCSLSSSSSSSTTMSPLGGSDNYDDGEDHVTAMTSDAEQLIKKLTTTAVLNGGGDDSTTWDQTMSLFPFGSVDDKVVLDMLQQEFGAFEQTTTPSRRQLFQSSANETTTELLLTMELNDNSRSRNSSSGYNNDCLMKIFLNALGQVAKQTGGSSFGKMRGYSSSSSSQSSGILSRWCDFYRNSPYLEYAIMTLTLLCFVFIAFCYAKIFREIYFNSETPKHNARRLVMTTFLLLSTFLISYLPFTIFELMMVVAMHFKWTGGAHTKATSWSLYMAVHHILNSLFNTSPLLQPLIYAVRLSIVRRQIIRDLKQMLLRCPSFQKAICFGQSSLATLSTSPSASFRLPSFSIAKSERYESGARNLCGHPVIIKNDKTNEMQPMK